MIIILACKKGEEDWRITKRKKDSAEFWRGATTKAGSRRE